MACVLPAQAGGYDIRNSLRSHVSLSFSLSTHARSLSLLRPWLKHPVRTALLLGIRFSKDRGDVNTRLRHLHKFASSELDRFSTEKAGTVALLALCGVQMGVQIRLGLPDAVLGTAKKVSALISSAPGLVRCGVVSCCVVVRFQRLGMYYIMPLCCLLCPVSQSRWGHSVFVLCSSCTK